MAFAEHGLHYTISLTDLMSPGVKEIVKEVDKLGARGKQAMMQIGVGAAGLVATGMALSRALAPAIDMQRALGEVKSLDVSENALNKLKDTALEFSSAYGGVAADFVKSSYDIQSAIAGLSDDELASFTRASNLLAKGTKSTADTITNYMGTMYGIFADEADQMGKANWVDKIAGQTAAAVKMFKTDGNKMSDAFKTLGATAKAAGINIAEQYAVLGNLQATMSGSESATKYKSFLTNVFKAQKKLGLSFTDNNNQMLDMVTILGKIKQKYGATIDEAESAELKTAFGTDEAVATIKLLLPQLHKLKGDIHSIAQVSNTVDLDKMARAQLDPWQQLSAILTNIKIAIGGEVLKAINPLAQKIADLGGDFVKWLTTYKNIARWIGYIIGLLIGFAAITATITLVVGLFKAWAVAAAFVASPIGLIVLAIAGIGVVIYSVRNEIKAFFSGLITGLKKAGISFDPVINAFGRMWRSLSNIWAIFSRLNDALTFTIDSSYDLSSIGELVGRSFGFIFDIFVDGLNTLANLFEIIEVFFVSVTQHLIKLWDDVVNNWSKKSAGEIFGDLVSGIGNIFADLWVGVKNMALESINFIIRQINKVSGLVGFKFDEFEIDKDSSFYNRTGASESLLNTTKALTTNTMATPNLQLNDNAKPQLVNSSTTGINTKNIANNVNNSVNIHKIEVNNPQNMQEILNEAQKLSNARAALAY
ncbi:phage tail tape measure protein [Pasteurellaceae bacterium TAE3-ERU1]|nr:phage tail tape measure protein [Pasteurellaceae bacterium TAE3-ERU1]